MLEELKKNDIKKTFDNLKKQINPTITQAILVIQKPKKEKKDLQIVLIVLGENGSEKIQIAEILQAKGKELKDALISSNIAKPDKDNMFG